MQVSQPVRYGVLFLVALLAGGIAWVGVGRYRAEQGTLQLVASSVAEAAPNPPSAEAKSAPVSSAPTAAPEPGPPVQLVVHVVGAVVSPGVYRLGKGARICDLIAAAGGPLPDGAPNALNLAAPLADGDKVWVPTRQEEKAPASPLPPPATQGVTVVPVATESRAGVSAAVSASTQGSAAAKSKAKVNINTAGSAELTSVTGIGPATAKAILEYRTQHGPFKTVDELDAVSGIGPKTLEKLRPQVTV